MKILFYDFMKIMLDKVVNVCYCRGVQRKYTTSEREETTWKDLKTT